MSTNKELKTQKEEERYAPEIHTHIVGDIEDFSSKVSTVFENIVLDDENYEGNKETNQAKIKATSQDLLNAEIKRLAKIYAQSEHTHLQSDIVDFPHEHDEYATLLELASLDPEKGASLIGATLENVAGTNVLEILNSLKAMVQEGNDNFFVKKPVKVVSTTNINSLEGVSHTIDGVEPFRTGDRVLLVGQVDKTENGIYEVRSDTWIRGTDMDEDKELAENIIVFVEEGKEHINTGWRLEVKSPIIGGIRQPLKIGESAIHGKPFSYNRSLRSSATIEVTATGDNNVLSPKLRMTMNNLPADAIFGRVEVDRYGRVIGGDLMGPRGRDMLLEDYNIINAYTKAQTLSEIEDAINELSDEFGDGFLETIEDLKNYADTSLQEHNEDEDAHNPLRLKIHEEIKNSTSYFKHTHHDLYYTKGELSEAGDAKGASLIGTMHIPDIQVVGSNNVQNVLSALKVYIDTTTQGLDVKESVRASTTDNIVLSGLQTIDTVPLKEGNRVLVKDQKVLSENGIYDVSTGDWERSKDAVGDFVTSGLFAFVEEGKTNIHTGWKLSTPDPIIVGETDLVFGQFSAAGVTHAGQGLEQKGTTIFMPDVIKGGTYTRLTVDSMGKVVGGRMPEKIAELGIKDVYDKPKVDELISGRATWDLANDTDKGLLAPELYTKLTNLNEKAEENLPAWRKISNGKTAISPTEKQDTLTFKGDGITISLSEKTVTLALESHKHKWADISDRPTKLPADGGNADSVGGFFPKDIAFHGDVVGSGEVNITSIKEAIETHNADEIAHPHFVNLLKNKADLQNGVLKKEQLPIDISIDWKDVAIIKENGNWWVYDVEKLQYVDTGQKAQGEKGENGTGMEVCDLGVVDLNNMVSLGFYAPTGESGGNQSNKPIDVKDFILEVLPKKEKVIQIFHALQADTILFVRSQIDGIWGEWLEIADTTLLDRLFQGDYFKPDYLGKATVGEKELPLIEAVEEAAKMGVTTIKNGEETNITLLLEIEEEYK